jgi:ribosome-binding factor A
MSQRANRVAEELRKIIAQILIEDLSDPRFGFTTVTKIHVTDDLRMGRVYYSVLGDDEKKKSTAESLEEHQGFIRRLVAERLNMKFAIEIRFELDPSIDHSFKIDNILKKIQEKNDGPSSV